MAGYGATGEFLDTQDTGWIQGTGANKEDVADKITQVDPIDTPGLARFGSGGVSGITHEWLDRGLVNPKNARTVSGSATFVSMVGGAAEGSDFTASQRTAPKRRKNVCQIFKQEFSITRSQAEVATYGIRNKLGEEMRGASQEMNRAIEARMWSNIAHDPYGYWGGAAHTLDGTDALPRLASTLPGMIARSVSGTTGFSPNVQSLGSAGTPAAVTEDNLLDLIMDISDDGGKPDVIFCHHRQKRKLNRLLSGLGIGVQAPSPRPMTGGVVPGVVRGYESDLGVMDLIGNRWIPLQDETMYFYSSKGAAPPAGSVQSIAESDTLLQGGLGAADSAGYIAVLTSSLISVDYLHRPAPDDIAKVGDALRGSMVAELTFKVEAPGQAHGFILNVAD